MQYVCNPQQESLLAVGAVLGSERVPRCGRDLQWKSEREARGEGER